MKLVETSKSDGIRDELRWISTSNKSSGTEPRQESSNFLQTNPTANTIGGVRESVTETLILTFNLVIFDYRGNQAPGVFYTLKITRHFV